MAISREQLLETAISQLGNAERTGNNDIFYNIEMWGKNHDYQPWCATFVSWCAKKSGIPQSTIVYNASARGIQSFFKKTNKYQSITYTPIPGDIAFFANNGSLGLNQPSNHVGIVIGCDRNNVYTLDGNSSNRVKCVSCSRNFNNNGWTILGYGVWSDSITSNISYNSKEAINNLNSKNPVQSVVYNTDYSNSIPATIAAPSSNNTITSPWQTSNNSQNIPQNVQNFTGNNGILSSNGNIYYSETLPAKLNEEPEVVTKTIIDSNTGAVLSEEEITIQTYELNGDASENVESDGVQENTSNIQNIIDNLNTGDIEKIGGISYNADGSYKPAETMDPEQVLKKVEAVGVMMDILSRGFETPNNSTFTFEDVSKYKDSILPSTNVNSLKNANPNDLANNANNTANTINNTSNITNNANNITNTAANKASSIQNGLNGMPTLKGTPKVTAPSISSIRNTALSNINSSTPQLQSIVNIASAVDKYGKAIKQGMTCPVCGKHVPYMPVQGFCSVECFTKDLTARLLTHLKRDEANPVNKILDRISKILDFFNLVLNVLTELPDILRNLVSLPDAIKNFVMVYINIIFLKIRMILNKLMIKKNEYIIYILKWMQRGVQTKTMQQMFMPVKAIIVTVRVLHQLFEQGYQIALQALKVYGINIEPESYAWMMTPRSMMNADSGQLVINLPIPNLQTAKAPFPSGLMNISMTAIDKIVQKVFPPIQSVEYFMDPDLFDVRYMLSDQSDLPKKFIEALEALLTFGLDFIPRWKRLSIINPFFVCAILNGWAVHGQRAFGSILQPTI